MKNFLLFLAAFALISVVSCTSDLYQIYNGVSNLDLHGGCYGPLDLQNENSFPIIKIGTQVFLAGTKYGSGRLISIGHNDPLTDDFLNTQDNGRLMANMYKWIANGKTSIKILSYQSTLSSAYGAKISSYGLNVNIVSQSSLSNLSTFDVIAFPYFGNYPAEMTDSAIASLVAYVQNGGSIILGSSGWVWIYYGDGQDKQKTLNNDFFSNKLFSKFGVLFKDGCDTFNALPVTKIEVNIENTPTIADRNAIFNGVSNLDMQGGCYSPLFLQNKNSFSIVKSQSQTFFSGTLYGLGHVVAVGHNSPFSTSFLSLQNNGVFMSNLFKWMANGKSTVSILNYKNALSSDYGTKLSTFGITAKVTSQNTLSNLQNFDVVAFPHFGTYPIEMTESSLGSLEAYVKNGGSIFLGSLAWVWLSYGEGTNHEKSLYSDFFSNKLFSKFGVLFLDGCDTLSALPISKVDPKVNEVRARTFLKNFQAKLKSGTSLSQSDITEGKAVDNLLQSDDWVNMDTVLNGDGFTYSSFLMTYGSSKYLPNPNSIIYGKDETGNLLYSLLRTISKKLPAEKVLAFPDATLWPGTTTSTQRETRTITLPTQRSRYFCTGLYANAGEVVKVTLDNSANLKYGIEILVGTGDNLYDKPDKKRVRFPIVNEQFPLLSTELSLSTPHGGMIYIYLNSAVPAGGVVKVTISNGVPAPYFNEDVNTDIEWFQTLRNYPAPFFNLECQGLIFILKVTPYIKSMTNVKSLCEWWDKVYQGYPYLSGDIRNYKEVIMGDIEIGGGYMHSGMPIMTYLDVVDFSMGKDGKLFTECSWGHFHELGHNYQVSDWTFDGTGEVTNNIWSLYGGFKMCGFKPLQNPWFGGNLQNNMRNFLAAPSFDKWKNDPALALIMYAQVADAFGFEVFRKAFLEYRTLEGKERPQNEDQKHDQWLVRLSKAAGRNLGPFFTKWSIPTSQTARDSVANLPGWMPTF